MSENNVSALPNKGTNIEEFLDGLDGGTFRAMLARALSETAQNVVTHGDKGKKGKVTVTFDVARIGESLQVQVTHALAMSMPTARGKKSEDAKTSTPFYVGRNGKLTLLPENQDALPGFERNRN